MKQETPATNWRRNDYHTLATLRAALRYWQEGLCPHVSDVMRHYFDVPELKPLSYLEIDRLRTWIASAALRYGLYARARNELADTRLFSTADEAMRAAAQPLEIVTVLLPAP